MSILPIAIDALGGQHADAPTQGAALAKDIPSVFIGNLIDTSFGDDVVQVITAEEDGVAAVRKHPNASIVRAVREVAEHRASAVVSAGNLAAIMASALLGLGKSRGADQVALAAEVNSLDGSRTVLIDAGANNESSASAIVQFAQMGTVYAQVCFGVDTPKVGLLGGGSDAPRSEATRKKANTLFLQTPNIKYVGMIDGAISLSEVDVIVTDGVTGDVFLKSRSSAIESTVAAIATAISGSGDSAFKQKFVSATGEIAHSLSNSSAGIAAVVGLDGICVSCPSSSDSRVWNQAIALAAQLVEENFVDKARFALRG